MGLASSALEDLVVARRTGNLVQGSRGAVVLTPIDITGSYLVLPEVHEDERGVFMQVWCQHEFAARDLAPHMRQANMSRTLEKGTIRGLHFQVAPHREAKLVRCTKGVIYDVVLDLRRESPTYMEWRGVELDSSGLEMLYVPEGCAHGYQTLQDDTEVVYLVSEPYVPAAERGVRHDDPAFDISWPTEVTRVSEKDGAWPDYDVRPRD